MMLFLTMPPVLNQSAFAHPGEQKDGRHPFRSFELLCHQGRLSPLWRFDISDLVGTSLEMVSYRPPGSAQVASMCLKCLPWSGLLRVFLLFLRLHVFWLPGQQMELNMAQKSHLRPGLSICLKPKVAYTYDIPSWPQPPLHHSFSLCFAS